MEIRTTKEREAPPQQPPAPEKSRYLRRPPPQKIRKIQSAGIVTRTIRVIRKTAVVVIAVAAVVSLLMFAFTSERLTVRDITFHGCNRADARKLEAVIRPHCLGHILRLDLASLREQLEAESWVRRAELRRMLPSDLIVYIEEREPRAILEIGGINMMADEDGILLDNYDQKFGKLYTPIFKGFLGENAESYRMYRQENSERVRLGLKLLSELEAGSTAYTTAISEVDLSDRRNLKILLVDEPPEISIGDHDFLKRFQTLMANMTQYRDIKSRYNDIAYIDLRYEGQIVYRPRRMEVAETQH